MAPGILIHFRQFLLVFVLATTLAGCASAQGERYPQDEAASRRSSQQATDRAVKGAAIGALAGNVFGYLTDSDRKTTTFLGALLGATIGYWQGLEEERRLQQSEAFAQDILRVQQSQGTYRYGEPRLYARETMVGGRKVADFDRLEASFPAAALRARSPEAVSILNRMGDWAARNRTTVTVYGPDRETRNFMITELSNGAGEAELNLSVRQDADARVVLSNGGQPER